MRNLENNDQNLQEIIATENKLQAKIQELKEKHDPTEQEKAALFY